MSKMDPYRRITLLPDVITEDTKVALTALFGRLMDELNSREANNILIRSCQNNSKETNNVSKVTTRSCSVSSGSGAKRYALVIQR